MSYPVVVPHWLAQKIRERYGSLDAYSEQRWSGALKFVDGYWDLLARESQDRINERLIRAWRRG
jgi:hypothetical protein